MLTNFDFIWCNLEKISYYPNDSHLSRDRADAVIFRRPFKIMKYYSSACLQLMRSSRHTCEII